MSQEPRAAGAAGPGGTQELWLHDLTADGQGVGRLPDGEVVFVPGGLPGDRAKVALVGRRRGVLGGRLLELVQPSEARVAARCDNLQCGGCPLRQLSAEAQGRAKRRRAVAALARLAGIDVEAMMPEVATFADGWGLRHRARLHASWQGDRWRLGYHAAGSRQVVAIDRCPLLWPELEALALSLGEALAGCPKEAGLGEVDLCFSRRDGRGAARLALAGPLASMRQSLPWFDASGLSACDLRAPDGRFVRGNLELRYDHAHSDRFDLKFEPGLFTQACVLGNDRVVAEVAELAQVGGGCRVLECHAGIGNFTATLARQGAQVVAYELEPRAAALCRRNNAAAGLNVAVIGEPALAAMGEPDAFDVVLLDPPRTGAGELMATLARRRQQRIVYVSCDVATLARDARHLLHHGWRLCGIRGWDMFPQSPHLEVLAYFEPA